MNYKFIIYSNLAVYTVYTLLLICLPSHYLIVCTGLSFFPLSNSPYDLCYLFKHASTDFFISVYYLKMLPEKFLVNVIVT